MSRVLAARAKHFTLRRRDLVFVVLVLLAAGCTTVPQREAPKSAKGTVWETSCRPPVKTKVSSYKAVLTMPAPLCAKTVIESRLDFATSNATSTVMPLNQTFQKILDGGVANWSWRFVGTPSIAQEWRSGPVAPETPKASGTHTQSEKIPWSKAFADMYSIYRYVLNASPPPTQFRLHFVPRDYSVKRTETATTSLHGPITMSLFFPYAQRLAKTLKSKKPYVTAQRASYTIAIFPSCFEYMHVLFITGRLKVPNVLSHSVADWITCWAVTANALSAAGGHPTKKFPDTEQIRAEIKIKGPNLLRKRETDRYAELIAEENFNNLFAAKAKPARYNLDDPSVRNRLLKLARAMLQQPVDFTKQQLYPLDRLKSVPDYTGTPADASDGK